MFSYSFIDARINTYYNINIERRFLLKISELLKSLKNNGCYLVRHGKKHDIWYSPITGNEFPVPRHFAKEIPTGTLKSIKKDSGI